MECVIFFYLEALRAAATLRARALREAWNIAAVIPVEKGGVCSQFDKTCRVQKQQRSPTAAAVSGGSGLNDELQPQEEDFQGIYSLEFLARGAELLKRTRKGKIFTSFDQCRVGFVLILSFFCYSLFRFSSLEARLRLCQQDEPGFHPFFANSVITEIVLLNSLSLLVALCLCN